MTATVVQLPVAYHLAGLACEQCGRNGCTLVALTEGAPPRFWCSVACARPAGWPWLRPQREEVRA